MSVNDFYVAIQSALLSAKEQGWSLDWIERNANSAIDEFMEEYDIETGEEND